MVNIGIICEYNPLHLGHQKQFRLIREKLGNDCRIICLMSGDYVQRGMPAFTEKTIRAQAAVLSGADLVLELPVNCSLASAEGFATGGVRILSSFCDYLCFGTETQDETALMVSAEALLSPVYPPLLKKALKQGCSFPVARQTALEEMGFPGTAVTLPNDILALEYCKAILAQGTSMKPLPIFRAGSYHADTPDSKNPSASSLRRLAYSGQSFLDYLPVSSRSCFANAPLYAIEAGERAILGKLRTMTDAEFEALPYGSEGLWRKLMHASRRQPTLEAILADVKSKRYTRSRLDRMIMCAFLGLDRETMDTPAPYARILAFNDRGRAVLKDVKESASLRNAGEPVADLWWETEKRCGDLYGLFRIDGISAPGYAEHQRVFYAGSLEAGT